MSGIDWNPISANANGGTELAARALEARLPKELLDKFQIVLGRVRELDPSKIRIWWGQDLWDDPEASYLDCGGWKHFDRLVFVSNWQMHGFIERYQIPWSKCAVLQNAIEPIQEHTKPKGKIRILYTSSPHRGLAILYAVFKKLCDKYNIELVVFSSYSIYGWNHRDEPFEPLFKMLREDPKVQFTQGASNSEVRKAIETCHIFGYPSTWRETSCIALIEAMSGGLMCVHPNYGCLAETAANWTTMYQFDENPEEHAAVFYSALDRAIQVLADPRMSVHLAEQKDYTDRFYDWDLRIRQWTSLLRGLTNANAA
jgi:UDP-glucose:(glucosyl)LPS alpha-1,2-glucosyltransferase